MKHNAKGVLIGFVVGMTLAAGAAYAMEAITAPHAANHPARTAGTISESGTQTHPRSSVSTPTPGPVAEKEVAHKAKKAATAQKKRHTETSKKHATPTDTERHRETRHESAAPKHDDPPASVSPREGTGCADMTDDGHDADCSDSEQHDATHTEGEHHDGMGHE